MFIFAFQIKLLPHKGVRENSYLETGGPHVLKFWESILHIVDDVACFFANSGPRTVQLEQVSSEVFMALRNKII